MDKADHHRTLGHRCHTGDRNRYRHVLLVIGL